MHARSLVATLSVFFASAAWAQAPAPPPITPPPGPAPGGAEGSAGHNQMKFCPPAVPGARSTIKNTKTGVEMNITATDAKAQADIRDRAKHLAAMSAKKEELNKHTGEGEGGGGMGRCPVLMKDTKVTAKNTKTGAIVKIEVDPSETVAELQKTVKDRHEAMSAMPPPAAPK
jgi:TusA-related sulfurtransferase